MEIIDEIFTTDGRLNRLRYLKYQVFWSLTVAIVGFIGGFVTSDAESILITVPARILSLVGSIGGIMLTVRRLHDLDKSGWFILLALVPIVNMFFAIYVLFFKGTDGSNRFGADPLSR